MCEVAAGLVGNRLMYREAMYFERSGIMHIYFWNGNLMVSPESKSEGTRGNN